MNQTNKKGKDPDQDAYFWPNLHVERAAGRGSPPFMELKLEEFILGMDEIISLQTDAVIQNLMKKHLRNLLKDSP